MGLTEGKERGTGYFGGFYAQCWKVRFGLSTKVTRSQSNYVQIYMVSRGFLSCLRFYQSVKRVTIGHGHFMGIRRCGYH